MKFSTFLCICVIANFKLLFASVGDSIISYDKKPEFPKSPLMAEAGSNKPIQIHSLIRKYFAPIDESPREFIRKLTKEGVIPGRPLFIEQDATISSTTPAEFYRASTKKDVLINYVENSVDKFLNGNYPVQRANYLLDKDQLLRKNVASGVKIHQIDNDEISEGSGEIEHESSITGIPQVSPFIPKVPHDFFVPSTDYPKVSRHAVPQGGFGPLKEIRRHPGQKHYIEPKSLNEFEYDTKPSYKQGLLSSVFDFLGIQVPPQDDQNLDQALTHWILQHSPLNTNFKTHNNDKLNSGNNGIIHRFLTHSVTTLCLNQPDIVKDMVLEAFMGQWFVVMSSIDPLKSMSSCKILNYQKLNREDTKSTSQNEIGSVVQVLEMSYDPLISSQMPQLSSGYFLVTSPGQFAYRKSNHPEEISLKVMHLSELNKSGKYEYAVIGMNCNFPFFVISRSPDFQKYESEVNLVLEKKGLISGISLVSTIPEECSATIPRTIFDF